MRTEKIFVDGMWRDHIIADEGEHILLTGPIRGDVTLASGKVIDVRPDAIVVEDHCEAAEVSHLIGQRYAEEGHAHHDPSDPFVYDDAHWQDHIANCPNHEED